MNVGILGSGMVGQTIGQKLAAIGHTVVLGSRAPTELDAKKGNAGTLRDWLASSGSHAQIGSYAEAAVHGEMVINATDGKGSLAALEAAGAENLRGKILIDIANPLDFSSGTPKLFVSNDDSLAEQIQRAFPETRVVKTFNTMNASVMVNPQAVGNGDHTMFVSGDDQEAKAGVIELLQSFGWNDVLDLGGLSTARGTEMLLPLWVQLWGKLGTPLFQFKIVRQA